MTFPLNRLQADSLYQSLAVCQEKRAEKSKVPIDQLAELIAPLLEITALNPGSAVHLRRLVRVTTPAGSEGDQRVAIQGLMRRALQPPNRLNARSGEALRKHQNLTDALQNQSDERPSLVQLVPPLMALIEVAGLNMPPHFEWAEFFFRLFPADGRSVDDQVMVYQLREMLNRRSQCFSQTYRKMLTDFSRQAGKLKTRREQIAELRRMSELTAKQRLSQVIDLVGTNRHNLASALQEICSALWAERRVRGKLADFQNRVWRQLAHSPGYLTLGKAFHLASEGSKRRLDEMVKEFDGEHFTSIYSHYLSATEAYWQLGRCVYRWPASITEARVDPWEEHLAQFARFAAEFRKTPVPPALLHCQGLWRQFNESLLEHCDLENLSRFKLFVACDLVELTLAIFARQKVRLDLAQLAFPSLDFIHKCFVPLWHSALLAKTHFTLTDEEFFNDLATSERVLAQMARANEALYALAKARLDEITAHRGKEAATWLCYRKNLFSFGEVGWLPSTLTSPRASGTRRSSTVQGDDVLASAALVSKRVDWNAAGSPDGDSAIAAERGELAKWEQRRFHLADWQTVLIYHRRVLRWFDATTPLNPKSFPEYSSRSIRHQARMIRQHRLIPALDFFLARGQELPPQESWGENVKRIALPAELISPDGLQRGIVLWAFNAEHICYHRYFHAQLDRDSAELTATLERAIEESIRRETLQETRDCSSCVELIFDNPAAEGVVIDELLGVGTLKSASIPDVVLRLYFMDL